MISVPDRQRAVELIAEAMADGASASKGCEELEISLRTYQRWTATGGVVKADARPQTERPRRLSR